MAGNFPASFDGKALPEFFMYRLYFTPPPQLKVKDSYFEIILFSQKSKCVPS